MSSIALPRGPWPEVSDRVRGLVIAGVCAVAAGALLLLHLRSPLPYATFEGACQRLRASSLRVTDRDWFCHAPGVGAHVASAVAAVLVGIGCASGSAILAATGRRGTAFVPLLGAPWIAPPGLVSAAGWWWQTATWPAGTLAAGAISLLLVAAPAAAILLTSRPRPVRRPAVSVAGAALAGGACALVLVPVALATFGIVDRHFASVGWNGDRWALFAPAVVVGLFGAMLGPDRRWWPWSIAPIALLASMAPSLAITIGPERLTDWSRFGIVLPLFLVGIVSSAWRPLAERVTRRLAGPDVEPIAVDEPPPVASVVSSRRPKALRPTAVLNALAIGVVAVCPIAFRADPLPVRIGTPLPTYLGLRDAVADARAKMNLGLALAALTSYREEHGGYVGFDDAVGESLAPELAWTGRDVGDPEPLVVHVWKTAPHAALVSAVSGSGAVFCLAAGAHGSATYGQARASSDGVTAEAIHRAVGACGGSPWPSSPPPVPAIRAMCDGVQDGGYVLCRMVQVVAVETLAKSDPTA